MNSFNLKCRIAKLLDIFGVNKFMLYHLNKKHGNNYVRVVNYHHCNEIDKEQFIRQINWYNEHFYICSMEDLESFLAGKKQFTNKPALLLTFDDGFLDNYTVAHQVLSEMNLSAVYMVSAGLVGKKIPGDDLEAEYIGMDQLKKMISQKASIGCHTFTHHRMKIDDTEKTLIYEIVEAKQELERMLEIPVTIFCWCGGEENTYTKAASDVIRSAGFKYSFMTNSAPIETGCDRFQLDRSNIEAGWPLSLVRFQLSGFIDKRLAPKRARVHDITK